MTKKITKGWWKKLLLIWLVLFVSGSVWYYMGASKLKSKAGTGINIDRSGDYSLFKINDSAAFYINPKTPGQITLAKYETAFPLFKIFGDYSYKGEFFGGAPLKKADWVYVQTPNYYDKGRIIGYNTTTGETLIKQTPADPASTQIPVEYLNNDLLIDDSLLMKPADIAKSYQPLSVPKESAITFFTGFLIVGILILILWPFARKRITV